MDGEIDEIELPVNPELLITKKLLKELDYTLNLPITGITYEQAMAFCAWKTRMDNLDNHKTSNGTRHYEYRLPTAEEYTTLNSNRDSLPKNQFDAFNYKSMKGDFKDSLYSEWLGNRLVAAYEFRLDKYGIYGIQGNAAEMTLRKGLAAGGSYAHYAKECKSGNLQEYTKPEPWLGFRCAADDNIMDSCGIEDKFIYPGSQGILLGYEGWHSNIVEVGLGFNLEKNTSFEKNGFIGFSTSYKKDLNSAYWGINSDLWIGQGFTFGLSYNYNNKENLINSGFRPFIGLAYSYFSIAYGYNFHAKTSISEINTSQLIVRYYLPVHKMKVE